MKILKWLIINGVFAGLIYAGYVVGIEGAENVALFFAWINIFFAFFLVHDDAIKKINETGRSVPAWVNIAYDIGIAVTFAWFGAWITAFFWIIHLLLMEVAFEKALKE